MGSNPLDRYMLLPVYAVYLYQCVLDMSRCLSLYLFSWLGTLIGTLQSCGLWSWILTLCLGLALYVPTTFCVKVVDFHLFWAKHNLDSLTHKGYSFFCYSGPPGIANWLVIILLSLGTSPFVSSEGNVSEYLSWLSCLCARLYSCCLLFLWLF